MAKEKITYILGAGASIGAFPLVKPTEQWKNNGLADELIAHGNSLLQHYKQYHEYSDTVKKIMNSLKEVGEKANQFGNVDSYAKYLYHMGEVNKLRDLKMALAFYFVARQVCNPENTNEKRYLNFITSIVDERNMFPDNVKVLSWNYDYLFQIAGALYRNDEFSERKGVAHYSPHFIDYYPRPGYEFQLTHPDYAKEGFSVAHLNGIAGFYIEKNESNSNVYKSIFHDLKCIGKKERISELDVLIEFHKKYMHNPNLITFAWEKGTEINNRLANSIQIAKEIIKGTTILVVIGYSFPFYNREVDNAIIQTITAKEKYTLKKIYFQDPFVDGEFLRKRYSLITPEESQQTVHMAMNQYIKPGVEVEHITYTDQFYVPIEL
jgi:hypothetical protein